MSGRISVRMSDYDRKLVSSAGLARHDLILPSPEAAPVYTPAYGKLILALEGDTDALDALHTPATDPS